jgi:hypothetical protein
MGLNTYMYAPKDDCKHRAFWRDLYSVEEAGKTHPKSKKYTSRCFLPNNAKFVVGLCYILIILPKF